MSRAGLTLASLGYFSLVAGVISLKYFRRRTMVLVTWPILMVGLAATAIATQRFLASGQTNKAAGNAAVALVWLYNIPSCYISPLFYSCESRLFLQRSLSDTYRPGRGAQLLDPWKGNGCLEHRQPGMGSVRQLRQLYRPRQHCELSCVGSSDSRS